MKVYMKIRALALPSDILSTSYSKYLMSIGVTSPGLYGTVTLIISLFVLDNYFINHLSWSYVSLAWGFVFARYVADCTTLISSLFYPAVRNTLTFPHRDAFLNLTEFLSLGLPGCAMLCTEWWAFELLSIFASQLGSEEVAAQTIIGQLSGVAFMLPLGMGVTASSLVGHALGSGDQLLAISYAKISLCCLVAVETLICPAIILFAHIFVITFTDSVGVLNICVRASHVVALFTFADGLQGVLSGILRGCGKQSYGALTNFISYYAIGLPLAWALCFHSSLGVVGLMAGIAVGITVQAAVLLLVLVWKKDECFRRLENTAESDNSIALPDKDLDEQEGQVELPLHSPYSQEGPVAIAGGRESLP
jgi:putative MATE family efflux protein